MGEESTETTRSAAERSFRQRPGRFRRALGRVALTLGLGTVFTAGVVAGAVVHLNTGAARRVANRVVDQVLRGTFRGELHIQGVQHLGLGRLQLARVAVRDPRGVEVLRLEDVGARFSALTIVREALIGSGPMRISVPEVSARRGEVVLDRLPDDKLALAEAFSAVAEPEPEPQQPGRPLHLELGRIRLERAWIHGSPAEGLDIDAVVADLASSLRVTPERTRFGLERICIAEQRVLPVGIETCGQGHVELLDGKPEDAEVALAGSAGDIDVRVDGWLRGGRVWASVEMPRVTPAAAAALLPDAPLHRPVAVLVRAEGKLDALKVDAGVQILAGSDEGSGNVDGDDEEGGTILLHGSLDALNPRRITAELETRRVDPRVFAPEAPEAKVSAAARAEITIGEGAPKVAAVVRTRPLEVAGVPVPALEARGRFDDGRLHGMATIHEPGAPISLTYQVEGEDVRVDASASIPSLAAMTRLPPGFQGSGAVRVSGELRGGALDARVSAQVKGFQGAGVTLDQGFVKARVHGPLSRGEEEKEGPPPLQVDAAVEGDGLLLAGKRYDAARVLAAGPLEAMRVTASLAGAYRSYKVAATLDAPGVEARGVRIAAEVGDSWVDGRIARVGQRGDRLVVEGLALEGNGGRIEGALTLGGPAGIEGELRGSDVDVSRLASIAGLDTQIGGLANLDLAMRGAGAKREGHLLLEFAEGELPGVAPRMGTNVAVRLRGDALEADGMVRLVVPRRPQDEGPGQVSACDGAIGRVLMEQGKAKLDGPLFAARTWEKAAGSVRISAESADLGCVASAMPGQLALSELGGRAIARFTVAREEGDAFPVVRDLVVRTEGLRAAGPIDERTSMPTWATSDLDVRLSGELGEASRVELALFDDREILVELGAGIELDPKVLMAGAAAQSAAIRRAPIAAHLRIPRRQLADSEALPPLVRQQLPPLVGEVQFDAYAAGTLAEPRVVVRALASGLGPALAAGGTEGGLAWDALVLHDGRDLSLDLSAIQGDRRRLQARAQGRVDLGRILTGEGEAQGDVVSGGTLDVTIDELPLSEIPFLAEMDLDGAARGTITGRNLLEPVGAQGAAPELKAHVEIPEFQLGSRGFFDVTELDVNVGPAGGAGASRAEARLNLEGRSGGRLTAKARTRMVWTSGAPSVEKEDGAHITLEADRFRLGAIEAFLGESVSYLDGHLDGQVKLDLGTRTGFEGEMRVSEAALHVPAIGQELTGVHVRVRAQPNGELRVEDLRAESSGGEILGDAVVRMDGLDLVSARAEVRIPEGQEIPVSAAGTALGTMHGRVVVRAKPEKDKVALEVAVPQLKLTMPPSVPRPVQPLDDNQDIVTSHPLSREQYEARFGPREEPGEAGPPLVVTIKLGDIRIGGEMIQASLRGDPKNPLRVIVGEETRVEGDIRLRRGRLKVLGKELSFEPSLIHFRQEEEPSNPYVNIAASYLAPDDTQILIRYKGSLMPITDEKLELSSDPPRPENEVMAVLLFGSELDDGTLAGGAPDPGPSPGVKGAALGAAAKLGAGVASAPLAAIVRSISPIPDVETQLGTTDEGALKASMRYQLGRGVTASASFAPGSDVPGKAQASPGLAEVTLEWRFIREWFLRAAVGTGESEGAALDVLWKHRY